MGRLWRRRGGPWREPRSRVVGGTRDPAARRRAHDRSKCFRERHAHRSIGRRSARTGSGRRCAAHHCRSARAQQGTAREHGRRTHSGTGCRQRAAPGRDRSASTGPGSTPAGTKDGGYGPTHRWGCARFQQSADRGIGVAGAAGAAHFRRGKLAPASYRATRRITRRQAHRIIAGLCAQAAPRPDPR